ncbi:hypothetical protein ACODT3_42730 [Streptomyces sp. 4.24]|uniref:hypothetical protein n=1 Tax=Streptomyces tritrimontium TaxID=3406573 RepID=UPI003BB6FC3F
MSTATAAPPATAPAATGGPPHSDAAAVDHLGRPVCEGTTHRETRNCDRLADFKLLRPGQKGADYACAGHLGQVAQTLNGGESGPDYEHRLIPVRAKE